MAQTISSGVKITVDTQDLFKFTKSAEQLNATLTKSQKALKLVYNEQGLLTNSLGRCVEGLSQSQIKLGLWADELGRVRTLNGEFASGLSKIQLEMGFYADELGNVYNAAGVLVSGLDDAANKLDDVADKSAAARNEVDGLNDVFGSLAGILGGDFQAAFGKLREIGELDEKLRSFARNGGSLGSALGGKLATGAKVAANAIRGVGLALGPVGVAIAAATAAAIALSKVLEIGRAPLEDYPEEFRKIELEARKTGETIKTLGDALRGMQNAEGATGGSEIRSTLEDIRLYEESGISREQWDRIADEKAKYSNVGLGWLSEFTDLAWHKIGNYLTGADNVAQAEKYAKITEFVKGLKESQKTEEDRILNQIADVQAVLAQAPDLDPESRAILEKEIKRLKDGLADARAALEERTRAELESKLGVDFDAKPNLTADESFKAAQAELDAALAKGVVSSEQFATAQDQLRDKYAEALATRQATDDAEKSVADKIAEWNQALADGKVSQERCNKAIAELEKAARDKAASELGVNLDAAEPLSFGDKMKKAAANLADGTFSQADYDKATSQLRDQERAKLASETGVDGETAKSPLDAYAERVERWQTALEQGVVDQERYDAAVAQLRDAARAQIAGLETSKSANDEYAETLRKLNEARKAELISEDERARLEAEAAKKRDEARKGELADLGYGALLDRASELDKSTDAEEKTARERYREELNKYRDALENGRITQEEFDKAQDALRKIRNAEIKAEEKKAAEDKAKKRDETRSKLGVDALMESLKTPAEKYNETMDEIAAAAKAREITAEERQALEDKAASDYWAALEENNRKFGEATKSLAKAGGGKVELAKSMSSGSEALYLSQVRGITANYQNRIQSTTAEIRDVARESLWQASQTNGYLQTMAEGGGGGTRRFVFTGN